MEATSSTSSSARRWTKPGCETSFPVFSQRCASSGRSRHSSSGLVVKCNCTWFPAPTSGTSRKVEKVSGVIKLSSPATAEFWEIPILHEDPQLLALNKPSGLLVSPDRNDPARPNLMRLLHRDIQRGAPWTRERAVTYLM